jgi:large subunit ribosomal protein L3
VKVAEIIDVTLFKPGDKVDVVGISKGKGYAGGVKRYHFRGGPKTHGQSDRWRAPGSIGSGTTPGRVLKGLKMAGHMGSDKVTAKNLQVISVDPERHVILVKGAVPGSKKGIVLVRKAN